MIKSSADAFYKAVLQAFLESKVPFLLGGTYAVSSYTGITRPTKDLDLFVHAGDQVQALDFFRKKKFKVSVPDERWLAKIVKNSAEVDVIHALANAMIPVNDSWFQDKHTTKIFGLKVPILSPTELIWSKTIVQDRYKNDMSDIMHLILRTHERVDWRRLLSHMGQYWELMLVIILYFRFIYPTEREVIPRWLLDELLSRVQSQLSVPTPDKKLTRGRLLSRQDYEIDVTEWGFKDLND